jgi:hypothetical protein
MEYAIFLGLFERTLVHVNFARRIAMFAAAQSDGNSRTWGDCEKILLATG